MKNSKLVWAAVVAMLTIAGTGFGQQTTGSQTAGQTSNAQQAATPAQIPNPGTVATQAPVPQITAQEPQPFPAVNPKNFTASSPSPEEVNSFLKELWGYDENRVWSVAAILATPAPGVSKVVVFVAEKGQPGKGSQTVFFTTPDGKHAIADNVIDFGATPFAANRQLLEERADGPAQGAKGKDLLIVEFADLECPHCKDAQDKMGHILQDFPQARVVFENFPLTELHPFAFQAAAEGVCVRKAEGDAAFFTYVQAVFDTQAGLTKESADATLAAAATKAAADPAAAAACAKTQAAKADVEASMKLGNDLGVNETPMLAVNGRLLPISAIPYEVLKKIIVFQAGEDGIVVKVQPTLSTLH